MKHNLPVQQDIKYNDDYNEYFNSMIYQMELLVEGYNELLQIKANSGHNEKKLNIFLARAVVITSQIIVKLEGSGTKCVDLLEEFEPYRNWERDLVTIKSDEKEMEKIPDLVRLILRSYDRLGYTN